MASEDPHTGKAQHTTKPCKVADRRTTLNSQYSTPFTQTTVPGMLVAKILVNVLSLGRASFNTHLYNHRHSTCT